MFRRKNQKKPDRYGSWHKIRREKIDDPAGEENTDIISSFSDSEDRTSEQSLGDAEPEAAEAFSHKKTFEEDESLEQLDTIISNLKQKSQKVHSEKVTASAEAKTDHNEIADMAKALINKLEQCDEKELALALTSESSQKLKDMLTDRKFTPSESAERQ